MCATPQSEKGHVISSLIGLIGEWYQLLSMLSNVWICSNITYQIQNISLVATARDQCVRSLKAENSHQPSLKMKTLSWWPKTFSPSRTCGLRRWRFRLLKTSHGLEKATKRLWKILESLEKNPKRQMSWKKTLIFSGQNILSIDNVPELPGPRETASTTCLAWH